MFNPKRLSLARKRKGWTRTELARKSEIPVRTLISYENGAREPGQDNLTVLATVLSKPVEFFSGPDIELPATDGVSWRALTNMTAGQRDASLAAGALAIELSKWIDARFELPNPDIPSLPGYEPETAARMLRADWGLGERPIKNAVHLLEAHGVRVFSLPIDSLSVDAFSVWHNGRPFVFLNTKKSGEHGRFDACHELGHLCLHRHGGPRGRDAEREAQRFSSAFLMPEGSVLPCAPRTPTLRALIVLKKNWAVSVEAVAYRLHALKFVSDWNYRRLCIEMAQAGYHRKEPEGIARETSQVLMKVFAGLRAEGMKRTRIARELCLQVEELDSLVFGLLPLSPIQGGVSESPVKTAQGRAHLRIV